MVSNHEEKDSLIKGNKDGNISKWVLWKSFKDELKRYGDFKFAIEDQSKKLGNIKKEIGDSAIQKQDSLTFFRLAISLLDAIKMEMAFWERLLDYFEEYFVNKNGNISFFSFLTLNVFLIKVDFDKGDKKSNR